MRKQIILTINVEDGLNEEEMELFINNLVAQCRSKNSMVFYTKGLRTKSKVLRDIIESGWSLNKK